MNKRYIFEAHFGKFWKFPVYVEFEETDIHTDDTGKITSASGKGEVTVFGRSWIGEKCLSGILWIDHISYDVKDFLNQNFNTALELPTGFYFKINGIVEVED